MSEQGAAVKINSLNVHSIPIVLLGRHGKTMQTSGEGFHFLLKSGSRPYRSSICYIVADPLIRDPNEWSVVLEPPENAAWTHPIDDIKSWMLHSPKSVRRIFYKEKDLKSPYREIERGEVFRQYVRLLLDRIPESHRNSRKHVLMPAISDAESRTRYKDAISAAVPDVSIIPEPEMVAEYFRLLQRTLHLERGENNVLLVLDIGASTVNMTMIVSRRDQTIVKTDESGAERDIRLRALRGDSIGNGGRWINERLIELLKIPEHLVENGAARVYEAVEVAKVNCSQSCKPVPVDLPIAGSQPEVTTEMLERLSQELCEKIQPLFRQLCTQLFANQTSSEDARRKSEVRYKERGVSNPDEAHRLVDCVMLAGGTSLLPGFQAAMLKSLFGEAPMPQVLRVGDAFPVVAAAGAMAYVLRSYAPPRLRAQDSDSDAGFRATLEATLPFPIVLGVKKQDENELQTVVLDPDEAFYDNGGIRRIGNLPYLAAKSRPKMRLVPGDTAPLQLRRSRQFNRLYVKRDEPAVEIEWNADTQEARVHSPDIEGADGALWISANKLRIREEPPTHPYRDDRPSGSLAVDGSDDVVIDLGMSKIVALGATPGWISAQRIQEIATQPPDDSSPEIGPTSHDLSMPSAERTESPAAQASLVSHAIPVRMEPANSELRGTATPTDAKPSLSFQEGSALLPDRKNSGDGVSPDKNDGVRWNSVLPDQAFSRALEELRVAVQQSSLNIPIDDIIVSLLALTIRPFVLLAGPPGCGKTTLVRVVAHLLGKQLGQTFHLVPVQAHWENDEPLFGENGLLHQLTNGGSSHLVLFDEFNLTRPEYFLSRFFHAIESTEGRQSEDLNLAPCRAFGTLNIDDTSRPPSPKIVDRCFLVEMTPPPWEVGHPTQLKDLAFLPQLPGLPCLPTLGADTDERIVDVMKALAQAVEEHNLRNDILPSRRVLADTRAILSLHHRLDLEAHKLLSRHQLVDRVLSSRILVKLAGSFDQLKPALEALEKTVGNAEELPRTRRRLRLARQQATLGFISPWQ